MLVRQFAAATSRSAAVISTCISFSAAANTLTSISGPTGGAVPNAGGVPDGAALGPPALALDGWSMALGGCSVASPTVSTLPMAVVLATAAEPAMAAEV